MIRKKMPKVPPPWRFATSFSKVMLGLVLLLLSVLLLRSVSCGSCIEVRVTVCPRSVFTSSDTTTSHKEGNSKERNLKFVGRSHNEEEQPKDEYVEVLREEPRASLSLSSSLDKFLAEERQKHNPGRRVPLREEPSLTVGGAAPANIDQGDILNLKTALRDPAFVNKIKKVEDRRQELYLKILRNKGQIVVGEDGGQTIVSYPQVNTGLPLWCSTDRVLYSDPGEVSQQHEEKPRGLVREGVRGRVEGDVRMMLMLQEKIWLNITHFPWPTESEECRRYSVQFSRAGDLPVVGLASYPSSGNTWLRYLIEGVTGYYTGSMYNDISLRKKGFYGEGVPADAGLVLTVKTHGHTTGPGAHVADKVKVEYNHHTEVNHSAILLIRNPYKAIIGLLLLSLIANTPHLKSPHFRPQEPGLGRTHGLCQGGAVPGPRLAGVCRDQGGSLASLLQRLAGK